MIPDLLLRAAGNAAVGDPYYGYVSLLLHFNGANGSTTFADSSSNALTVTPYGNAQISTAQSKFGGAGGYFDGSGDYIEPVSTTTASFGTGDFTVEFWFYTNSTASQQNIIDKLGGSINAIYMAPGGQLRYFNGSTDAITGGTLSTATWYHISLVRYSGITKLYLNGVQSGSNYTDTQNYANSGNIRIGAAFNATCSVNGYIDELRITLNVARYTTNFIVPSAPFPDRIGSVEADAYFPQTSLLLHMDGTNASTSFVDSGPNAYSLTNTGSPVISTTQSKFGGAAGYFDGSSNIGATNSAFDFGTSDFTVEYWFYASSFPSVAQGYIQICGNYTSSSMIGFGLVTPTAGSTKIYATTLTVGYTGTTNISVNTWYHAAFVRSSGTLKIYLNGVLESTHSVSTSFSVSSFTVGRGNSSDKPYFGYIDDLRVTKGVARYTANFTPRAKAFPDNYNPYKTLPVSGAVLWLDGADSSTLFTDAGVNPVKVSGDLVYQWNDKSGNSRHATQTTSGNRPTWVPPASGINNFGTVAANGSTQFFTVANTSSWSLVYTGDFTINIIHKVTSTAGGVLFGQSNGPGGTPKWALGYGSSGIVGAGYLGFHYNGGGFNGSVRVAWTPTANTVYRITATRSGNDHYFFINGVQVGTTQTTSSRPGLPTNNACVFQLGNGDGSFAVGQIAEIAIYASYLGTSDQSAFSSYSLTKWGVA